MNDKPTRNFLIVGELPRDYLSQTCITEDPDVVTGKLGLTGQQVAGEELDRRQQDADEQTVQKLARDLVSGAEHRRSDQPADEHILAAMRMYLGLRSLVED
ncbi:MAG: hypothetical protein ACOC9S_04250, partial [Planctomycetota bacterium]